MTSRIFIVVLIAVLPAARSAVDQATSANPVRQMPAASFVLHDDEKAQPSKVVLGPMHTNEKGQNSGSFAVYGGSSMVQISSLAMDGEGKLLAVGSTPNRVDLWDIASKKLLRSFSGGTMVALSHDGKTLVTDGDGLQIWDVDSGKLRRRIERKGGFIRQLVLDASSTRLLVSANGENDVVFDLATGARLATLTNTQEGQFSNDGSLVIGGNAEHLNVWDTTTWKLARTFPNGPDYVTRFAVSPDSSFIVIGGPKAARLVRADSGETMAKLGDGYTNFASFTSDGRFILTYGRQFIVSDATGKPLCQREHIGNGDVALSRNGKWLASAQVGGRDVLMWNLTDVIQVCGMAN